MKLPILFVFSAIPLFSQGNLQDYIDKAKNMDTITLNEGTYIASPKYYNDETCGNCLEQNTPVHGTMGFLIKDKAVFIRGVNKEKVILKTNAGYGVLFINSNKSSISNLTISGGIRDTSGDATNGGIVLKNSSVNIFDCIISNDTVRINKLPVVGICGIVLREGSVADIYNNLISYNTWDGIALYRGATAFIHDNIIEYGRGAGIGITWDANAVVQRNSVSHYWKGIGTFGTSNARVSNNVVTDNLGWGIVISGNSQMLAENNVITRNGNCGIAPWCDSTENISAYITNNIITENGWKNEWVCPQVGLWMNAPSGMVTFTYNDVWNNYSGNYKDIQDQTGMGGNLSVDPVFRSKNDFTLDDSSPLINNGNPELKNKDGKKSSMGIEGGEFAK